MSKFIAYFNRISRFIRFDIWRVTENELSKSRRLLYRFVKIIVLAVRGFIVDDLNVKASAFTYSILFAVVPLFALIIAIGKGFGVEKMIEGSLQETFIGQSNMIPTVMGFVDRYLETTTGGLFIGVGLAVLVISVMNFFMQVENAFNSIWQVKKSRSIFHQFSTYFSAILVIPFFIVISSGLSIYINTALSQSFLNEVLTPLLRVGVKFTPFIINWIVFTIMYMVIPNTQVRFKNAFIAGVLAGSAFQAFQILYIHGQVYLSRYNIIYGGFAAIPLLLLWLQISCLIILLGAEISYASQNVKNFEYEVDTNNISIRYKNFITLFVAYIITKHFEQQKPALSSEDIAFNYKLPIRLVNQSLLKLVEVSILVEILSEETKIKTYLPALDINKLTVNLIYTKLEIHGSELFLTKKNELMDSFWHKTIELKEKANELSKDILLKDL